MSIGWRIFEKMNRPAHDMKASQFEEFSPAPGGIVFLGDSITEGGLWGEWFRDAPIVNRGIGGDTTNGVLARLDTAIAGPPAKVFLLIGTNDLSRKDKPEEIAPRTSQIVERIRVASPGTAVYLQSVMPRNSKYLSRITDLNERYRRIARAEGAQFVDLWPALADTDGTLRAEYTRDALHLSGAGYRAWVDVLRDHVT